MKRRVLNNIDYKADQGQSSNERKQKLSSRRRFGNVFNVAIFEILFGKPPNKVKEKINDFKYAS